MQRFSLKWLPGLQDVVVAMQPACHGNGKIMAVVKQGTLLPQ
jgi:hypothetical protein